MKLFILPVFILLSAFSLPVYAQGNSNKIEAMEEKRDEMMEKKADRVEAMEEKKTEIMEKKEEKVQNRCEMLTNKVNNRIERFNDNKDKHLNRYSRIRERVEALLTRLEEAGYDSTTLGTKLAVLNDMLNDSAELYQTFINKLEASKDYECGNSEGNFADAIKEARDALKVFNQSMLDIRDYFKTEIKPELITIRDWLADQDVDMKKEATPGEGYGTLSN